MKKTINILIGILGLILLIPFAIPLIIGGTASVLSWIAHKLIRLFNYGIVFVEYLAQKNNS